MVTMVYSSSLVQNGVRGKPVQGSREKSRLTEEEEKQIKDNQTLNLQVDIFGQFPDMF